MARRTFVFIVRMAVLASTNERRKWSDHINDRHYPLPPGVDPDLVTPPGPNQTRPHGRPRRHSASPRIGVAAPHDRVFFFRRRRPGGELPGPPEPPGGATPRWGTRWGSFIRHRSNEITQASDCSRPV